MRENIKGQGTSFKGNGIVLGQMFGSGKTEFSKRMFKNGPWLDLVKQKKTDFGEEYDALITTTTLYIPTITARQVDFESALIQALLETSITLDLSTGRKDHIYGLREKRLVVKYMQEYIPTLKLILEDLRSHYGTEICIILDEVDSLVLNKMKHYYSGNSVIDRYYEILEVLYSGDPKLVLFVLCGKSMDFSMIGRGIYHHQGNTPPFWLKPLVLSPLQPKHLKTLLYDIKINSQSLISYFDIEPHLEDYFIEKLHEYTAGIPRVIEKTLKELYLLGGPWNEDMFSPDSNLSKMILRYISFKLPEKEEHIFGVSQLLYLSVFGPNEFSYDQMIPLESGVEVEILQLISVTTMYIEPIDDFKFRIVVPELMRKKINYSNLIFNYLRIAQQSPQFIRKGPLLEFIVQPRLLQLLKNHYADFELPPLDSLDLNSTPIHLPQLSDKDNQDLDLDFNLDKKVNVKHGKNLIRKGLKPGQIGVLGRQSHSSDLVVKLSDNFVVSVALTFQKPDTTDLGTKKLNDEIKKASYTNIGECLLLVIAPNPGHLDTVATSKVYCPSEKPYDITRSRKTKGGRKGMCSFTSTHH
eukprot:TRINITY_DN4152_c0_g1_i7.p1 TRINITY_DN4152_c0_g1~~TRINITY_DN4152_c0_g1_i7.p1  ORF type:complete len:582 (+),score=80.91 TRINITY_DN4152_c0_g1_i7:961-2706(+)